MNSALPAFREPSTGEKIFNRVFGFLVGLGLGFPYNYLLEVRATDKVTQDVLLRTASFTVKPPR